MSKRHHFRQSGYLRAADSAESVVLEDVNELIELRAQQRTFDGAYSRTALSCLGYALTILRLFDSRFFHIGILYIILAGLLFVISYLRHKRYRRRFAGSPELMSPATECAATDSCTPVHQGLPTVGQTGKQCFGRPIVTAGWIVVGMSLIVSLMEISLLVLVLNL